MDSDHYKQIKDSEAAGKYQIFCNSLHGEVNETFNSALVA
jgi:hypothetical protein